MRDPEFFLHRYAPTTTHLAFFKMPINELADRLLEREEWVNQNAELPWTVTRTDADGGFATKLNGLLPLVSGVPTKTLVSQTNSEWSLYLPNGWRGGDVHTPPRYVNRTWQIETLTIILTRDIPGGQPGSMQFVLRGLGNDIDAKHTRAVAAHKESRWEFHQSGAPMPFEEVEQYDAKRIKDRLTAEMIERYCAHLGIQLFDPDFYAGKGYIINTYQTPNAQLLPNFPNQSEGTE